MAAFVRRAALVVLLSACIAAGPSRAADASGDQDVRAFFERFVAAQNAHDADAVGTMLWDSPEMLWFTRGVEVRGRAAVVQRMREYYEGTWHLEPDMAAFHATALGNGVVQTLVPIMFTRGAPGQPTQQDRFLISQTFLRGPDGWRIATILPIANTQLK